MAKYLLRNTLVALMCSHARHAYRARQITKKWPGKCLESLISQEKKENVQKNARIMYFQCLSFHLVYISSVKLKKKPPSLSRYIGTTYHFRSFGTFTVFSEHKVTRKLFIIADISRKKGKCSKVRADYVFSMFELSFGIYFIS